MKRIEIIAAALCLGFAPLRAQNEIVIHNDKTNQDDIIDLPEGMILNVDSLLIEWNAKNYLSPDDDCQMQNINPVFATEVYIDRLSRIPSLMEMPHNAVVQSFIDRYTGQLRRSVAYMLGAGNFYMPLFEEALDLYGLPLELKYLPVIESALNPTIASHKGAVGLWQFILPTGKRYGLTVNSLIDERCDPVKASYAAARYLKDLYAIYGDWNLVIAAYNCGPSTVNKAIHRADGSRDYWKIYPYLPRETRGYVPAFIAANYVMTYYCEHNICPMKTILPTATDTVVVNREVYFEQIAAVCNLSVEEIQALNPQYRTHLIPGNAFPCTLRLPPNNLIAFIDAKDSVYTYQIENLPARRKMVEIAEDTSSKPAASTKNKKAVATRRNSTRKATVRKGDTLSDIAKRNGTTVAKIRRLNGISGNNIRAGKQIRVK